jgi:hypothetical protein
VPRFEVPADAKSFVILRGKDGFSVAEDGPEPRIVIACRDEAHARAVLAELEAGAKVIEVPLAL